MAKNPIGVFSRGTGRKRTWWARLKFKDENGKVRDFQRRAESQAHAGELRKELEKLYNKDGGKSLLNQAKTFAELADHYQKQYLKPAEYHEETGRKISGLRSHRTPLMQLRYAREFFGKKKLQSINYEDLLAYRQMRLEKPIEKEVWTKTETTAKNIKGKIKRKKTVVTRPRAIASVNRELALLRKMFNVAERMRWIDRSPFKDGDSLISIADEKKRDRVLTQAEEQRLLAACTGKREHLGPIIICALDTGMRKSEILRLMWNEVDLESNRIRVLATNTKTLSERTVPITSRLKTELLKIQNKYGYSVEKGENFPVFTGIFHFYLSRKSDFDIKHSFDSARREAGLPDVRFHDLRHTAATRLVRAGMPLEDVGKILGHSQAQTTYRYVNSDADTLRRAGAALDSYRDSLPEKEENEKKG
jgi:integrase